MKFLTLETLKFPLFVIKGKQLWEKDGVLYLENSSGVVKIVDDKNFSGNLAIRRLKVNKKHLYKINKTIFTLACLLTHKGNSTFLTTEGSIVRYKKSKYVPLICKRITYIDRIEGKGYLIYIDGLNYPILKPVSLFNVLAKFAQLLITSSGPILYNLLENEVKDTVRKI